MAMKVVLFYGTAEAGKPFSTTETHYYLPDGDDFTACQARADTLASARNQMMGTGVKFFGIRMSLEGEARTARFVPSGQMTKAGVPIGSGNTGSKFGAADQPNACILLRASHDNKRQKNIYLTGVPDELIQTNPVGPNLNKVVGWEAKFNNYKKILKEDNIWGFKGRKLNPTKTNVVDYVQQDNGAGLLGVVTTVDVAAVGDKVQLRNVKLINPSLPKVNGQYYVTSKDTDVGAGTFTYFLRNSADLIANNIADPGTIEKVEFDYFAYDCVRIMGQTSRKRGVSALAPRGKSSRRST